MVLRIVEKPSCARKNIKIHAHVGYNCDLSIAETPSYTRENISNRSYTDSNTERVPTNQQNIAKLYDRSYVIIIIMKNDAKRGGLWAPYIALLKGRSRHYVWRLLLG